MNLLATGLVLVCAVLLGRMVLGWWRADQRNAQAGRAAQDVVGSGLALDESQPFQLDLGPQLGRLSRQTFHGGLGEVLDQLTRAARTTGLASAASEGEVGPAESKLLARLATTEPVDGQPGEWAVYRLEEPYPMAVCVRETQAGPNIVGGARRVVSWGLGIPLGKDQWTLFAFAPGAESQASVAIDELPLPPNSRRTFVLRSARHESLVTISGSGIPSDWKDFFDTWFKQHDWPDATWRQIAGVWHARFEQPRQGRIDVQFLADDEQTLTGLLTVVPPAAADLEPEK
jgi:hypothetical protein